MFGVPMSTMGICLLGGALGANHSAAQVGVSSKRHELHGGRSRLRGRRVQECRQEHSVQDKTGKEGPVRAGQVIVRRISFAAGGAMLGCAVLLASWVQARERERAVVCV